MVLHFDRVPSEDLAQLFTPNIIRTLMNNAGNPNNYLHKAAVHAVRSLGETAVHAHGETEVLQMGS